MDFHYLCRTILLFALVYFGRSEEECLNADEDRVCLESCPKGTFVYNPGCDNVTMSQRTCRQREQRSLGTFCDYVRCDCLDEKYWDEAAKECVLLEQCTDQSNVGDDV